MDRGSPLTRNYSEGHPVSGIGSEGGKIELITLKLYFHVPPALCATGNRNDTYSQGLFFRVAPRVRYGKRPSIIAESTVFRSFKGPLGYYCFKRCGFVALRHTWREMVIGMGA